MAPMAGVTDSFFRALVWEYGAEFTVSEMVSAKSIVYANKNTFRLMENNNIRPWAVQFFGHEPEILAEAIKRLEGFPFDIADINMGCPMPKIVKNGEGAALMANPSLAGKMIEAAVKASDRPVTVKIRKGFAGTANCVEIARIAQESGASAVAVHGRTREQYYSGAADWGAISAVKAALKIPVIGNGDIFTPEDAVSRLKESGCDGVMIARGALGNPWIFRRTQAFMETGVLPPPPAFAEIIETAVRHLHMVATSAENASGHGGHAPRIFEMRKHLGWYTKGMPGSAEVRRRLNNAQSAEEMEEILREIKI